MARVRGSRARVAAARGQPAARRWPDRVAVHGVGGAIGTLLVAFLVDASFGGGGLAEGMTMRSQFGVQLIGLVAVLLWSLVASFILVKVVQAVVGLRVSDDEELKGLDVTSHGETGYNL